MRSHTKAYKDLRDDVFTFLDELSQKQPYDAVLFSKAVKHEFKVTIAAARSFIKGWHNAFRD